MDLITAEEFKALIPGLPWYENGAYTEWGRKQHSRYITAREWMRRGVPREDVEAWAPRHENSRAPRYWKRFVAKNPNYPREKIPCTHWVPAHIDHLHDLLRPEVRERLYEYQREQEKVRLK